MFCGKVMIGSVLIGELGEVRFSLGKEWETIHKVLVTLQ